LRWLAASTQLLLDVDRTMLEQLRDWDPHA
jgi:hypothetical protein